jgi:pimeloyl-ACP methyl ester carboxylesterase
MKLLITLFVLAFVSMANAAEVIDVPSTQGTPTRTLLVSSSSPKATVLLFIGGDGQLRLTEDGQTKHGHTFVRSIDRWASHSINAVLIDTPFDLGNAMRGHKRGTSEHLTRVAEVTAYYSKKTITPLWIFGHSMGSSTVAAFLSSGRPEIGLLKGYIVAGTHKGESVPVSIKLPALGIHHRKEACEATPIEASEAIINSRSPDTPKAMVLLDGGEDKGHRCQARAFHGFNGIENQFVDAAATFILKH